jgi:hypothetical protein
LVPFVQGRAIGAEVNCSVLVDYRRDGGRLVREHSQMEKSRTLAVRCRKGEDGETNVEGTPFCRGPLG